MNFDFSIYEDKMKKALEVLKKDFSGLRTGRASVSLLDSINVEAYGAKVPINQISNISTFHDGSQDVNISIIRI